MCECATCRAGGPTYTEAHRAACEARAVAQMADEARGTYLERVRGIRGDAAHAALMDALADHARV